MDARVTVAINKAGLFCGIVKGGGGGLEPTALCEMLQVRSTLHFDSIRFEDTNSTDLVIHSRRPERLACNY